MAFEITSEKVICPKCGTAFGKRRGNFPVSYAAMYKGLGYIPICKDCIDNMYQTYLAQCGRAEIAVRQMCRKLDLYWNQNIFDYVFKKGGGRSIIFQYIIRTNIVSHAGKCYDDTLMDEDTLWNFEINQEEEESENEEADVQAESEAAEKKVTRKMIKFWGSVYPPEMILQLEERYKYWMSRLPDDSEIDIGTELLLKQISALDIDINNCRAGDGKNVDKLISTQSNLLRDLNLKPVQRKNNTDESEVLMKPLGVWLDIFEHDEPVPKPKKELRDVNHHLRYIFTWMGHLCKMLGIKAGYTKLYEQMMAKLRIDKPERDDEDDEDVLIDFLDDGEEDVML